MELAQGEKLGPYEIQRKVGAGGMGVVYRALDSRLGRAVAIKVLPVALKGDPERLKRFEREARTIGSLNHGNLVTLFDVGTHEGVPFLVTELLDGKSLRQALAAAPNRRFSTREAVRIAGEIARGLAAAHGAGVTHRDIKPDNIFVLADDRVKILDFGIAKLSEEASAAEDAAEGNAATLAGVGGVGAGGGGGGGTAHTGTGIVIGTPGYMAPEQLAGGAVGPRTDLFALGVVFYEMLAGRRPFAGDEGSDSASNIEESYAILKQVTPELPTSVPPALSRVVRRCLEKRPEARFQSASDLAFALGDIEANSSAVYSQAHHAAVAATAATAAQPAIAGVGTTSSGIPAIPGATTGHVKTLPGAAVVVAEVPPADAPEARISAAKLAAQGTGTSPAPIAATGSGPIAAPAPAQRNLGPWILASVVIVAVAVVVGLKITRTSASTAATGTPSAATPHPPAAWPGLVEGGAEYHRVTFLPQSSTFARFGKDQTTVVWSARKGDGPWRVMQSDVNEPSLADLNLGGRVLDVSRTGELALRTKGSGEGGTLERGRPGMGAPQFVADHVEEAVWAPDGDTFAILRANTDHTVSLEDPIGKVILTSKLDVGGSLAQLRMSHAGFLGVVVTDSPARMDGRTAGRVTIVDSTGGIVAQSKPYGRIDGIAWSGDELWFAEGTSIRALARDGKERLLLRTLLPLGLKDVSTDGRMLVAPREVRTRTLRGPMSATANELANVGWFDGSLVTGISADGATIVFLETTGARDENGYFAFRRTGIEPPVSIGRAFAVALLPDASATFAITGPVSPPRLIPSGDKPAAELPRGGIARFDIADRPTISWNGKVAIVRAASAGRRMRLWRYDLEHPSATPVPVGPDQIGDGPHPVSSDGAWIAVTDRGNGILLLSTAQPPEPAQQIVIDDAAAAKGEDEHTPIGWAGDDSAIYLTKLHNYPRALERLDRATKARTVVTTIAPDEKPDSLTIVVDREGANLAYSLVIETSELYVIRPPVGPIPPP